MLNAAIVGLGRWGQLLVDSVHGRSDKIQFIAAATRSPDKVRAYCESRAIRLYDAYQTALEDPAVDAVVLATPHSFHFDQIVAAARAGKHVFCEKPFVLKRTDAAEALEVIRAAGLTVAVGHNRRFAPNTIELKKQIESGDLGQLIHIEGNFSADLSGQGEAWRGNRTESPAGGMTSLGIHIVDAFIHLFGRVREVQARSCRLALPFDVDDSTSVFVLFESGRTGYLGTVAASARYWALRAFGTKGWAQAYEQDEYAFLMTDGTEGHTRFPGYTYPATNTLRIELEAFAEAVAGIRPFPIPPDEILHGVAVLEAIIQSADDGGIAVQVA